MRYATYSLYYPTEGSSEGFTPEVAIRAKGTSIDKAFFSNNHRRQ